LDHTFFFKKETTIFFYGFNKKRFFKHKFCIKIKPQQQKRTTPQKSRCLKTLQL